MFLHNLKQLAISIDQVLNVVMCCIIGEQAWADETLSAHAYRWEKTGVRSWPRKLIDALLWFDKEHCFESYQSERFGLQLPPELRPKPKRKNREV